MYGATGAAMRAEFAELLRQHRIQRRLHGTHAERVEILHLVREYRQTVLIWCSQTLHAIGPFSFSNMPPADHNPFHAAGKSGTGATPARQLSRAVDQAVRESTVKPAYGDKLTTPNDTALVEHWRLAARAAALAERDTTHGVSESMTAGQAQVVVADIAAITQAIVILDERYRKTPGWQHLPNGPRLGWTSLAAALDVSLGQPDYTVDKLGWRPNRKLMTGPAKEGILGVLQAEHNLVIRMQTFPNAINLRYVIDSQKILSRRLVPFAARIDPRLAERWSTRAETYKDLQRQFVEIGGRIGKGGYAAAEGAKAVSRMKAVPPDTIVEPRVLAGFQLLFDRLDRRIAAIVEEGVDRFAFFQRVTLPRVVEGSGQAVHPLRERFVPVDRTANSELIETVRDRLLPRRPDVPATPGATRVDLHVALLDREVRRTGPPNAPSL